MNDGTPSHVRTTATRLKRTRAVGRANFAKTRPVTSASPRPPTIISAVASRFAAVVRGQRFPYPTVAIVCTLKKNASAKLPGRACSIASPSAT